jgi:hypothetical protein
MLLQSMLELDPAPHRIGLKPLDKVTTMVLAIVEEGSDLLIVTQACVVSHAVIVVQELSHFLSVEY